MLNAARNRRCRIDRPIFGRADGNATRSTGAVWCVPSRRSGRRTIGLQTRRRSSSRKGPSPTCGRSSNRPCTAEGNRCRCHTQHNVACNQHSNPQPLHRPAAACGGCDVEPAARRVLCVPCRCSGRLPCPGPQLCRPAAGGLRVSREDRARAVSRQRSADVDFYAELWASAPSRPRT